MSEEEWAEKWAAELPERDETWVETLLQTYGLRSEA